MKKEIIVGCVMVSTIFISCKKEETKVVEEVQNNSTTFSGEDWLKQRVGNQVQTQPVQQQIQTNQAANGVSQQTPTGINPPHGQPNHRCDIPVGAPLNASPTQKSQNNSQPAAKPVQISQPTQMVSQPVEETKTVNSTVVTAPGMNPPHGQEGHRCDVAVGAPLPKS